MKLSIPEDTKKGIIEDLRQANLAFQKIYPGDSETRQPVHTVYGGAHLFKHSRIPQLGKIGLKTLQYYAPNFAVLARALHLSGHEEIPDDPQLIQQLEERFSQSKGKETDHPAYHAYAVYLKVINKLKEEPIEDFRIDFEDGFGNRSDEEEDTVAVTAAAETAKGLEEGTLSPFIGIRIKPFTEDLKERGLRTLDIYLSALVEKTGGKLPSNFVIMLPKVTIPQQVSALVRLLAVLESQLSLAPHSLIMEMMVETTQSIIDAEGKNPLRSLVEAAEGRCRSVAFGTYDYTAANNITARYQHMSHPVCDFAHYMTKVALGSTGIQLADGASNIMPVGPHRGDNLTDAQEKENREVVHRAWKIGYDHIRHSLYQGLYQGWDLNPAQLPVRYAAVYSFFLESYENAATRLKQFMEKSARASLSGDIFDDAATGQGLLNFFLQALNCGAITEKEATITGLSIDEIRTRSFLKILQGRS